MDTYTVVLDAWEGALDLDESVLWDGGVRGIISRINHTYGALHKDTLFDSQWAQSERFARAPYYVYDPFSSGVVNAEWLADNLPKECKRVFADIEIKRVNYAPAEYAKQVEAFAARILRNWNLTIYTGCWFLPNLSKWPKYLDYWWARYPYFLYPDKSQEISWEEIHRKMKILRWVPSCTVGNCKLWQCSADRYKPPGCAGRAVDLNAFPGTEAELYAYMGTSVTPSWQWQVTTALRNLGCQISDPE